MRSLLLQSSYVQFVEIICIDIKLVVVLSRFGFIQANTSFVAKAQRTKLSKGFRRFEFLTFVEFPQFPAIFDRQAQYKNVREILNFEILIMYISPIFNLILL